MILSSPCSSAQRSSSGVAKSSTSGSAKPTTRRSTDFRYRLQCEHASTRTWGVVSPTWSARPFSSVVEQPGQADRGNTQEAAQNAHTSRRMPCVSVSSLSSETCGGQPQHGQRGKRSALPGISTSSASASATGERKPRARNASGTGSLPNATAPASKSPPVSSANNNSVRRADSPSDTARAATLIGSGADAGRPWQNRRKRGDSPSIGRRSSCSRGRSDAGASTSGNHRAASPESQTAACKSSNDT